MIVENNLASEIFRVQRRAQNHNMPWPFYSVNLICPDNIIVHGRVYLTSNTENNSVKVHCEVNLNLSRRLPATLFREDHTQLQILIHILKWSPIASGNSFFSISFLDSKLPKYVHAVFQITYRHDIMINLFLFKA